MTVRTGQGNDNGIAPAAIIAEFYKPGSKAFRLLTRHGQQVAEKSLRVARSVEALTPDITFIEQAALLHDIGMIRTNTPALGCYGRHPYICHGILGREMLASLGFQDHAMVCERHVGVGLTATEIRRQGLPLPARDMIPLTLEEKIITYADKFFSKHPDRQQGEIPFGDVVRALERYGHRQVSAFLDWAELFGDR